MLKALDQHAVKKRSSASIHRPMLGAEPYTHWRRPPGCFRSDHAGCHRPPRSKLPHNTSKNNPRSSNPPFWIHANFAPNDRAGEYFWNSSTASFEGMLMCIQMGWKLMEDVWLSECRDIKCCFWPFRLTPMSLKHFIAWTTVNI